MNVKINLSFIDRYHAFVILSNFSLIFELKCTSLILGTYAIENAVIQNTRRSMRTYQYVKKSICEVIQSGWRAMDDFANT